jgi:hypothetical protein
MSRKKTTNMYFGPEQEEAVIRFLSEDDPDVRNKIYYYHLMHPLNKMIESIIRRYKLYRKDIAFEDVHADTLSFLITKFDKFKPEKGKKSYSFFGTICKNYLLGQLIKYDKMSKINLSYEDVYTHVNNREEMIYYIDNYEVKLESLMGDIILGIKEELITGNLNENEVKVGHAIVTIFENWETLFEKVDSGNKYAKNLILSYVRDLTGLTTKDIRLSMRKFKKMYFFIKDDKINKGLL